jgi:hypothetical protein
MIRVLGSLLVLGVLGGLFLVYRDSRSLEARSKALTNPVDDSLTAPPNWKVTSGSTASISRPAVYGSRPNSTVARGTGYGVAPSDPPVWSRRGGKIAATPTYMPGDRAVEPPKAVLLPLPAQRTGPRAAPTQALVAVPPRSRGGADSLASEEMHELLNHAKFLIKAGLSPMAKEPLQQILQKAPGTSVAREARLTLDTIRN